MTVLEAESLFEEQNATIESLDARLVDLNARVKTAQEAAAAAQTEVERLVPLRAKAEAEAAEAVRGAEDGKETMAKVCAWCVLLDFDFDFDFDFDPTFLHVHARRTLWYH